MTAAVDRIEKKITLRAPRARVWRALASSEEFGAWFGVKLRGPFTEGATIAGQLVHPKYQHIQMEMQIERIEPERYFAYRWHPYAIDDKIDYSAEPTTLVEFTLEDLGSEGTRLRIVESGFERIPAGRRAEAFRMNDSGWSTQATAIERHVSG